MEKLLPQNIQAEQGVLGSIILDPEMYSMVSSEVQTRDFYRDIHQTIFSAIASLAAKHMPADFITLSDELSRKGKLEEIGGINYLANLTNDVPTSGNAVYYARMVAKTALHRRLIHAAGLIAASAYSQDENALETAEKIIYGIDRTVSSSAFIPLSQIADECMEKLDSLHQKRGAITGITSGYSDIDDLLGGFQRTDLIILAGRPGMGKSSAAMCFAYNAALRGHKVAVFSLEMGRMQLGIRLFSMRSKIDMQRLRSGWIADEEWDPIMDTHKSLRELPIYINDTAGNVISSMTSQLRRLVQDHGVDMVVVDYLQLVEGEETEKRNHNTNRVQEISTISRGLKRIAKEFDVPVIALAQLSRKVEERADKRPMLSDLKESGAIEENADVVLFLFRDEYYAGHDKDGKSLSERPGIADLICAKHRNGPTGEVSLFFHAESTMFYPLTEAMEK